MNELDVPQRTILTPGPVAVDPRVLHALSFPILGQFDPDFTRIMNEVMDLLRQVFQTTNHWAYPVDGTSRAGIEAVLTGVVEPGDRVYVPIFGRFGYLLAEIAERLGADVVVTELEWGQVYDPADIIRHIHQFRPNVVAMVHGETSTGQMQPLAEVGRVCRELDILLVVDAVATVGGVEVLVDDWYLDAVMAGTQKCLSVPAGLGPLTYNARVERRLQRRKRVERGLRTAQEFPPGTRIPSNYLDLAQLQDYWSPARLNHHTESTSMLYGLREGLRLVVAETLAVRHARHRMHEQALVAGLSAMGLTLFGNPEHKLPVVTCVTIPDGVDGESIRAMLLAEFGIEIASSFGPLKGKIWRIGTMGYSCQKRNILHLLTALEAVLRWHGVAVEGGAGVQTALRYYVTQEQPNLA